MDNLLKTKSYAFALRIVNLYKHLAAEKSECVLSNQVLRSGTSVSANITEGNADDRSRISSISWKSPLKKLTRQSTGLTSCVTQARRQRLPPLWLLSDCSELQNMLTSSMKAAKSNIAQN